MMIAVMAMTPVHMSHHGSDLTQVGLVISLHIIGMWAFSPIFGWAADRFGPRAVIIAGIAMFALAFGLGIWDALNGAPNGVRISLSLFFLGLGWSAMFIGGSVLLTVSAPPGIRVPLQGFSDAAMGFGAAGFAAVAGPIVSLGGFATLNMIATVLLSAVIVVAVWSLRGPGERAGTGAGPVTGIESPSGAAVDEVSDSGSDSGSDAGAGRP